MSRLQRTIAQIVRQFHCHGTHHHFAIDALPCVETPAGKRLVSWLIYHHRDYLRGAVDPDQRFCDFHNHILHVDDGYWGGAPRVAHQWYRRLQTHLRAERFRDAAHSAGVLSHYVTDMLQPLHTVSNDREALVHQPLEWSIDQSYERIYRVWIEQKSEIVIQLSSHPAWLGSLMMHTAQHAHQYAEQLVRQYSFAEGTRSAKAGLDNASINCLAELFGLAITSWARVIDRAATEAENKMGYEFPRCKPFWALPLATLRAPRQRWKRHVRAARESLAIAELARQYFRTGQLTTALPNEVDIKQR
ncbi:MAG: zinc dependent phospholipase C family protein, partial [Planctomycetota bacterium]